MSLNRFLSIVDPSCLKLNYDLDEYTRIKNTCSYVNSTALYKLYRVEGGSMSYKDFYKNIKEYLYYDKYICAHGIEFMYLVKFKDRNLSSPLPTDVLNVERGIYVSNKR